MTVTAHRARRRWPAGTGRVRTAVAVAVLAAVLPAAACGMNAQTLKPYTPADGVNFDVGDQNVPDSVIHVRNLLVISRAPGSGIVAGSIVTSGRDSLVSITGAPYLPDGSKGSTYTASLPGPLLVTGSQIVLTDNQPLITVSGATGLQAGLDTDITLTFGKAGSVTRRTTVVDGNLAPYNDVTPSASPSASPTITAAPSPTP